MSILNYDYREGDKMYVEDQINFFACKKIFYVGNKNELRVIFVSLWLLHATLENMRTL